MIRHALLLAGGLVLAETAYADMPAQPVVRSAAALGSVRPNDANADITALDGKPLKHAPDVLPVTPGKHSFDVRCSLTDASGTSSTGQRTLSFAAEAGHAYQLYADPPEQGSKSCDPYVFDTTGGRGPYSETIHIPSSIGDPKNWQLSLAAAHAGHTLTELVLRGETAEQWSKMIQIESWTQLMFPEDAATQFQAETAALKQACPALQVKVYHQDEHNVTYAYTAPGSCSIMAEYGRFLTGALGVYHAAFRSHAAVPAAEQSRWQTELAATVVYDVQNGMPTP